jgi:L-glyceraldehyde 3-phosphate reductase
VLIGASSAEQVKVNLKAVEREPAFTKEELSAIDELCKRWK